MLEKDGKYKLDRSCEKWRRFKKGQVGNKYPTNIKRRKVNGIGHVSVRNCNLKYANDSKTEGRRNEEDVSRYWMTLRKGEDTGILTGSTRSHPMENSLLKTPWARLKAKSVYNRWRNSWTIQHMWRYVFYWKCQGKIPPWRSRCKLEDNIRTNSREVSSENAGWTELIGNSVHLWSLSVPLNAAISRIDK
jgi:hypothetical protein